MQPQSRRPPILALPPTRAVEAAQLCCAANVDDGLWRWVFPDERRRAQALRAQFAVRIRYGQRFGEVIAVSHRLAGVSVWLPGHRSGIPLPWLLRLGGPATLWASGARSSAKLLQLNGFYQRRHDRLLRRRHLYLAAIAVRPRHQGQGVGGRMLREMLAQADERALPCFLEAHTPANVALYRRFGFEVVDQAVLPGTDITDWAMVRPPGGVAPAARQAT